MPALTLTEAVKQAEYIDLVIHCQPDGDAMGAATALKLALGDKQVRIVCATEVPAVFAALVNQPVEKSLSDQVELIITLDCSQLDRTGLVKEITAKVKKSAKLAVIDHHENGDSSKLASFELRNTTVSSTAELVYLLLRSLRRPISAPIAQAILLGLYSDTGAFRHPNTSQQTLLIAGRLIASGASIEPIAQALSHQLTSEQRRLWGNILQTIQITEQNLAVAVVSRQLINNIKEATALAGLVNNLALIQEARAAMLIIETETGWQCQLRTRHANVNLRRLAGYFGGGGTRQTAGFTSDN